MDSCERLTDQLDIAAEITQMTTDALVERRVVYSGESQKECEDCGDTIPEARRQALPGCKLCPHCAQAEEDKKNHSIHRAVRY